MASSLPNAARAWLGTLLLTGGFLALAGWFVAGPELAEVPHTPIARVNEAYLSTGPRRQALSDPPVVHVNGFDRTCMECHKTFLSERPREVLGQHTHIRLKHGINRNCYDCHDKLDRNLLRRRDGSRLRFSESSKLCAQCHGSIHADWKVGMHGRTNGYWDPRRGEMRRLRCVECHDPHRPRTPAMSPLPPLPPPHTLRMGETTRHAEPETDHVEDPLRRALLRATRAAGGEAGVDGGKHR